MIEDFCKWIIGGEAVAIVAMGGYIVRLHLAERKLMKAWLKSVQGHSSTLEDE